MADPVFYPISAGSGGGTNTSGESAKGIIGQALAMFGLESLGEWAWGQYLNGASIDEIMLEIRQRPEYKLRFPAMEQLAASNRAISELAYIDYEKTVRGLIQRYGITAGMYDTPEQIAKLLLNDVSASEVNERLTIAAATTFEYPEEVRQRFFSEYGGGIGDMAAYVLDPDRAVDLIRQQAKAAQVYGAADQQRVQLDRLTAERLAANGVTFEQARQGFGQVAQTEGLGTGYGETIATGERIGAAFGDAEAARKQTRVQKGRRAAFSGGGSAAETQEGVSGLGGASTR